MRKHSRADAHEGQLPEYLRDYHRRREEEPVNFEELRSALAKLATWTEPISIPSDEEWEAMLVRRAVKAKWEHEALFWALRGYPGSEEIAGLRVGSRSSSRRINAQNLSRLGRTARN
jgi:hypothetical protein